MSKRNGVNGSHGTTSTAAVADACEMVEITVPFAHPVETKDYEGEQADSGVVSVGRTGVHVNVQLGAKAARGFMRLRNGLRTSTARLADGRPVWSNADALRYLLESMVDAAD